MRLTRKDEIPPTEWPAFFRGFISSHAGRLCSLAVSSSEDDQNVRFHPLLLASLGADNAAEPPRIHVLFTDWEGEQLAYWIDPARHVFLTRAPEHASETLEIEGAASTTMIRFQAAD